MATPTFDLTSVPNSKLANYMTDRMTENLKIQQYFNKASTDKFRAYVYYFLLPVFFFVVLAPGLLISIPPVDDCDSGVKKPIAPSRVTWTNALVHGFVFGGLVFLLFWYGSLHRIVFPFAALSLKV